MSGEIYLSSAAFITAWEDLGKNICADSVNQKGEVISLSSINVESPKDNPNTPSLWYSVAKKVLQLSAYEKKYLALSKEQREAAIANLAAKLTEKFGNANLYDVIMENGSAYWFFNPWDDFKNACATHNQTNTMPKGQLLPANINLKIKAEDINTAMIVAKQAYPLSACAVAGCADPQAPGPDLQYLPLMPGPVQTPAPKVESSEFRLTIYSDPDPIRTGAPAILQISGGKLFDKNSTLRIYNEDSIEVSSAILEGEPDIKEGLIKITLKAGVEPGLYTVKVTSSKIPDPIQSQTSISKDGAHTEAVLQPFTIIVEHGEGKFRVLEAQRTAAAPAGDAEAKEKAAAAEAAKRAAEDETAKKAADKRKALAYCGKVGDAEKKDCKDDVEEDLTYAQVRGKYKIAQKEETDAIKALRRCGQLSDPFKGICRGKVKYEGWTYGDVVKQWGPGR